MNELEQLEEVDVETAADLPAVDRANRRENAQSELLFKTWRRQEVPEELSAAVQLSLQEVLGQQSVGEQRMRARELLPLQQIEDLQSREVRVLRSQGLLDIYILMYFLKANA